MAELSQPLPSTADENLAKILEWNKKSPDAANVVVHSLFENQARLNPDRLAVHSWDGDLSYRQLDNLASHLAAVLIRRGIGSEVIVPICSEKSKWVIVSMFAVLKAGGAFVLLDIAQPTSRLRDIITQTRTHLLLTSQTSSDICKSLSTEYFVVDDQAFADLAEVYSGAAPSPDSAAYVIFTSGSTGAPKGVVVEHSQIATHVFNSKPRFGFGSATRTFQFSSYAFDACLIDILDTLCLGGTVCSPSDWERNNEPLETMRRMGVTTALLTPSFVNNFQVEKEVPTLKKLILGGEAVPAHLLERLLSNPGLEIFIQYGPAECAVSCFVSNIRQNQSSLISGDLGYAEGARGWIAKPECIDELATVGNVGELFIEGSQVARGYLHNAEKTALAFAARPEWTRHVPGWHQDHSRLYRTGDLVRQLSDGRLCFIGRTDGQVKIRGQRLELGEVEHAIQECLQGMAHFECSAVVAEAVDLRGATQKQLAVFLCTSEAVGQLDWESTPPILSSSPSEGQRLSEIVNEIQQRLEDLLPSHGRPSVYIPLRKIPTSLSLKTNRNFLSELVSKFSAEELGRLSSSHEAAVTAFTTREPDRIERMRALWAGVLPTGSVPKSGNPSFFMLGGDSILAIKLVATARKQLVDLSVETIYRDPALSDMAAKAGTLVQQDVTPKIAPFSLLGKVGVPEAIHREASQQCELPQENILDVYPCSHMQTGLLAALVKDSGAYVMRTVYDIPASTDLDKLRHAWDTIAQSTRMTAVRFFEYNGELLQVVTNERTQWKVVDDDLESFISSDKQNQMVLSKSMSYITVVQTLGEKKNHLVWTMHHALADGFSAGHFVSQVGMVYNRPDSAVSPQPGFANFIEALQHQDTQAAESFWRQELENAPAPTFPRLAKNHTPVASSQLERGFTLRSKGSFTFANMITAAWALLLGIYSQSSDVVAGVTRNGRTSSLPGIDAMPGPTIVTVPMRIQIEGHWTVLDLIGAVQESFLRALPFEQYGLQNISRSSKAAAAACSFQTLLVVQSAFESESEQKLFHNCRSYVTGMNYGLVLESEMNGNSVQLRATFDPEVLSDDEVQRILEQLDYLVSQISESDPNTPVSKLRKISDSDVAQISGWNKMVVQPQIAPYLVHDLISRQASRLGNASAICAWDGEMSYSVLDVAAKRLGTHLRAAHGVSPESLVGICFEKSKWTVVAMLAVLHAGGGCVLMSPETPDGRLKTILQTLGDNPAKLVLTSRSLEARLRCFNTSVLVVDQIAVDKLEKETYLTNDTQPRNTAFVVFTSGSTGVPKGIVLEHQHFCSSTLSWGRYFGFSEQTRVFQFSGLAFDMSIGDMFTTLMFGGCVCIPSEEDRLNNLGSSINSLQANHVFLTTTVASYLDPEDVPTLRSMAFGGERCRPKVIETWADRVKLFHMYGPAECAIYSTGSPVTGQTEPDNIGRGIGAYTWITDPEDPNILMPIGGIGELLIEGPGLARGYINSSANTQSVFIGDTSWSNASGGTPRRFYRTGDLARHNADGTISYIGRNDGQVKLRGQRIEFSEVEHQLRKALPSGTDMAVSIITPAEGEQTLAAFVVVKDETREDTEIFASSDKALSTFRALMHDIDATIHLSLPSYMVPSFYIPIRLLPLTASGKTDLRRLREAASHLRAMDLSSFLGNAGAVVAFKPPVTTMEKRLAPLWKRLLKVSQVSINDDFFRLGGNSLMAMKLVSLARSKGLAMRVDNVYKTPVLKDLALIITNSRQAADLAPFSLLPQAHAEDIRRQAAEQCHVSADEIVDMYPCSAMQHHTMDGGWKQKAPAIPRDWQLQMTLKMPESFDEVKFRRAWESLITRHPIFRTRIIKTRQGLFQLVLRDDPHVWAEADSLISYSKSDKRRPMTWGDQLLRLASVHCRETSARYFVMTIDHGIYDGYALGLLFAELEHDYFGRLEEKDVHPKMSRFIQYITGTDRTAAIEFWQPRLTSLDMKRLADVPDEVSVFNQTIASRTGAKPKLNHSNATLATAIEVALGISLSYHLGCADVVFYCDRTGRNLPVEGIQDLMGPTTLFLPLPIHIDTTQSASELLQQTQAFHVEMMPHEHLGVPELWRMNEFKPVLRQAVALNIKDFRLETVGGGLGLQFHDASATSDDPVGFSVMVDRDVIEWCMFYDERYVSTAAAEALLAQAESVLGRLVEASSAPEVTVAQILGLGLDGGSGMAEIGM
ncbi:hypothetical protein GGR57DRAFT_486397 [Xylariaceae sp. FL1272]|nr:hypothetical protein GGR57DRAFT_486397 [Xylariaceae sp. FL1272]